MTTASEAMVSFLHELDGWESAYPFSMFPEPELKKAAELLKAGGMTLDAVSASNMRHVVSRIAPKARAAITAIATIDSENERLREALEPFADFADPREQVPAEMHITSGSYLAKRQLLMGDCYKARAALSSPLAEGEK